MLLHHRDQYVPGQGEILFIERAHERSRHLDQVRHFVEETIVDDRLPPDERRSLADLLHDGRPALFLIQQDSRLADRIKIAIGGDNVDLRGAQRPQATGHIPGNNTSIFEWND